MNTLLARECNKEGLWLRALLTAAYSFAFRKSELLNLRVRQVDLLSRVIQLDAGTTKNDEPRMAPMTDEVFTLLTACVIGKQKNDYVLARQAARPGLPGEPVRGFRRRWAKVCCAVALGQLVCPACYPELKEQTVDAKCRCSACGKKWRHQRLQVCGPALPRSASKRCAEPDPRRRAAKSGDVNFGAQDRFGIPALQHR